MGFNPLQEKGIPIENQLRNWSELNVQPYDKNQVHPYSRTRVIAMNGIEVEGVMFSHQFARHSADLDLNRKLALVRRVEQQQQKAVNWLTPGNESTLEVTIGYEQVAVDLTAWLARHEPDPYLRQVYQFGLLEDFDHLYRYANLMHLLEGKPAERIIDHLTEVIPGRPTFQEHRHPFDDLRRPQDNTTSDIQSKLNALTITAAEQQTMNFYMTMGNRPMEPLARGLYLEIAQIEEQHVSQYESIMDPRATWFEQLVMHEYNECYLYWSFFQTESDPRLKQMWETHLAMEIEHLKMACELMKSYEGRDAQDMLPMEMPPPVTFESNVDYVRQVLASQISLTAQETDFLPMDALPPDSRYTWYQNKVNSGGFIPSEAVIDETRAAKGEYRLNLAGRHPIEWLRRPHAAE